MKLTRENVRAVYVSDLVNRLSIEFGWVTESGAKQWLDIDFVDDENLARGHHETVVLAPEVMAHLNSVVDSAIEAANAADNIKEVTGG